MDSPPKHSPKKKPYSAPLLQRYGNLARITTSVGNMGMLDGGTVKGMRRSQA